jgi:putative ABC transport system permease protein
VGPHARGYWTVERGAGLPEVDDPEAPIPLILTGDAASRLGLAPGDGVRLRAAQGKEDSSIAPSLPARIVGLGRAAFDAPSEATVLTTMAGFRAAGAARGADEADLLLIGSKPGTASDETVSAIRAAVPRVYPFSNEQFLTRFDRSDFSYFRQISFVLSAITLFFAFLLVATILTVSVNQRLGEVAALRALGFSRRRVVADLLWESALLVGFGGLLSVPLGLALARWLDAILKGIPGLPERLHFFVFEPRVALLHVALLAITAVVAALYPVWLAATLPIATTLRREVVS